MVAGGLALAILGFAGGFAAHRPKDKIVKVPGSTVTVTVPAKTITVPGPPTARLVIPDTDGAAAGVVEWYSLQFTGPVSDYYDFLHPAQQARIRKSLYLSCFGTPLTGAKVPSLIVTNIAVLPINLPEIPQKTATAVTFVVDNTTVRRFYTVKAGGKWRWIMGDKEVKTYEAGRCR